MCGIVAISSDQPVAVELFDSLVHLQHRGQDAAGIITYDKRLHIQHGIGLAREIFAPNDVSQLTGNMGIAHVRYPTAGGHSLQEVQPFWLGSPCGLALAHNGNLVNYQDIASKLLAQHRHLNSSTDSEVLLHLLADQLADAPKDEQQFFQQLCHAIQQVINQVTGSYSVVSLLVDRGLIAFRDPHGIRPLVMGERPTVEGKKAIIFASEPTMFYSLDFQSIGDVQPGEVVFVSQSGTLYRQIIEQRKITPCIFEQVYFARPDAKLDEVSVYRARLRMGQNLAAHWQEKYPDCLPDIVIPAPFTANTAALSFANSLGVRYSEGLYKNPFIGRTFIMPSTPQRKKSVRYKLTPQSTEIKNKIVLILDDSIVRGTTSREIVRMVREYGAKHVYFASACPPVKYPCFYGIDIPTRDELIAAYKTETEIKAYLGVDKLLYQNLADLIEAVTRRGQHQIDRPCAACLDGCYISGHGRVET